MRLYVAGIILWCLLFLFTLPYKRNERKKLNKKNHRLLFLYGMGMFLTNQIPEQLVYGKKSLNRMIKALSVRENIKRETYLYFVEKVSLSLGVLFAVLLVGLAVNISENSGSVSVVTQLRRDDRSENSYDLLAKKKNGEKESLNIVMKKKELKQEQIYKLFDESKEELIRKMLNKNKSTEHVDKNINLFDEFGKEKIYVTWEISDSSMVSYEGEILENVPEEGVIVELIATMTLDDTAREYTIPIQVFPTTESRNLQSKLQKYVDENAVYEKTVDLPQAIDGEQVSFYENTESETGWIFWIGIVIFVSAFFLKDRDMKKRVEKRNEQLLSDYPEVVSKILLFYEAGLSIKSSFERIIEEYHQEKKKNPKYFRYVYEELELAYTKMNSGVSQRDAINEYGNRCGIHCYIKLAGIIGQNLKRGTKEMSYALREEVNQALLERKNHGLKMGSLLSTKLLGPMVLMLVISMAIIMLPALMSMNY